MRLLLLTLLLLPVSLAAMEIEPFTAHYSVRFSGLAGETTTTLLQNEQGYVLENRTRAKGIARWMRPQDAVERSEFVIANGQLRPLAFSSQDGTRRNRRGSTIAFDWAGGNASASYKGESRDIRLSDGLLDRQLLQIAMMNDLGNGITKTSYRVLDRLDQKIYEITVTGTELVDVPAGRYETLRIERRRAGSSRSSVLWCAPSLNYLTVQMEQLKEGKVIATLALTGFE